MILLVLLFFCPIIVEAEKIETPYLYVGTVNQEYSLKENEKLIKQRTCILEEENPKITEKYYFEDKQKESKLKKTDDYIYTAWSPWQEKRLYHLEEEQKITYYYQALQKLDKLVIDHIKDITIMEVKIQQRNTNQIITVWKNTPLSFNQKIVIPLDNLYLPEELKITITTFLRQEKNKGSLQIRDKTGTYIQEKVEIKEKGISSIDYLLINCFIKMKWENKIQKTDTLENMIYYKLLKKDCKYRYRIKLYKYQKRPTMITSKICEKEGYLLKEEKKYYELYRKETIEVYDQIILKDYIDIERIIKSTTIPTKRLSFSILQKDGKNFLQIRCDSFFYEKEVEIESTNYQKSKRIIGTDYSIFRNIIGYLLKMSITKKF